MSRFKRSRSDVMLSGFFGFMLLCTIAFPILVLLAFGKLLCTYVFG